MMTAQATDKPIRSTIASRLMALLQHPKLRAMPTERELAVRLIRLGFTDPCSRCCGGGYYGPRQVQGGVCFKCNGKGIQAPKLTKALEAKVRAAVADGALESFVARAEQVAAARKAVKGAYDAVFARYKHTAWVQHFYGPTGNGKVTNPGYPLAWALVDLTKPAHDKAFDLDWKITSGRGTAADVDACLAAVAEYARAYEILDRAHAICLERGLYEQATAEHLKAKAKGYEAECRSRVKWAKVAAEIWAEVEARP